MNERVPFSREQRWVAALICSMIFLNYLDRQILSVLSPILRTEIHLSQTQYAWAVNSFLASYGVMYFGSGMVLDRIGARVGLPLFVALWSIVSAAHAGVRGFMDLAVLRCLLGIFEPGGWTGAIKTISEWFHPMQRAIATGIFATGSVVAVMITPPLVVYLSLHYGWRMAFLIPSLAGFVWLPLWWIIMRRPAPYRQLSGAPRFRLREALPLVRDKRVVAFMLVRFFGDFGGYFPMFWMPDYLTTQKGFSIAMLGALGWIPFLSNDLGPLFSGFASNRLIRAGWPVLFSRKVMMSVAAVLLASGALFSSSTSVVVVLLSLSLSTFGSGCWSGMMNTLPNDAFPKEKVATIYGLAGSMGSLGGILCNTLVGYLSSHGLYWAVFVMWSLLEPCGLVGAWLWLRDRPEDSPR
ncbi:MAG: MFS transporter [Bryobacteraceae bacterium]